MQNIWSLMEPVRDDLSNAKKGRVGFIGFAC
jgi:hypothetical protein